MDFVAIDFETAIQHHVCAVGIVTVKNGEIVDEYHTLIKPPNNKYSWHTIQVHGITQEDTRNAPSFRTVYPEIKKRLLGRKIVAHNEAFDRNVLIKTMNDNSLDYTDLEIANRWECTMKMCKASDRYPSGKLNECCVVEDIQLNHHEALSDARACAELFMKF